MNIFIIAAVIWSQNKMKSIHIADFFQNSICFLKLVFLASFERSLLLIFSIACLNGADHEKSVEPLIENSLYKEAISAYQILISAAPKENLGWLKSRLAIVYAKDQDLDSAFKTYVEALSFIQNEEPPVLSDEEKEYYEKALAVYLGQSQFTIEETAKKLQHDYGKIVSDHPDYYRLKLLISLSYANLNRIDGFFESFYDACRFFPSHYLTYKTRAMLHLKLMERGKTPDEKERERTNILAFLQKAMEANPNDRSLYKMMIAFSPECRKEESVRLYMGKMLEQDIVVPRCDILFYVQQAMAVKQEILAEQLLDKARKWYQFSKTIEQAEMVLGQHKRRADGS